MKKIVMGVVFIAMACFILPGASFAGKKAQTGDRDGTPDRERLKDGSCQDLIQPNSSVLLVAGKRAQSGDRDGTPDRKRLKDKSC